MSSYDRPPLRPYMFQAAFQAGDSERYKVEQSFCLALRKEIDRLSEEIKTILAERERAEKGVDLLLPRLAQEVKVNDDLRDECKSLQRQLCEQRKAKR